MISRTRQVSLPRRKIIRDGKIEEGGYRFEAVQEEVWVGWCSNAQHLAAQTATAAETHAICSYCGRRLKAPTSASVDASVVAEGQELLMSLINTSIRQHCYELADMLKKRYARTKNIHVN